MNAQDDLYRLLYQSRSTLAGSDVAIEQEVAAVLDTSRRNNARDGVTGALLFTASMFIQVLEAPRCMLEKTFERICCDLRHSEVEILEFAPLSERVFGAWTLHRVEADRATSTLFERLGESGTLYSGPDTAGAAIGLMVSLAKAQEPSLELAA